MATEAIPELYSMGKYNEQESGLPQTEIGKFPCNNCEKSFSFQPGLRRHIKSIHDGVRYPCNECEYKATTGDNLKRHLQRSHC